MTIIKISDLHPTGSEFFQDDESFLSDLTETREIEAVAGGTISIPPSYICQTYCPKSPNTISFTVFSHN